MATNFLTLGPVQFADFELPSSISWGGEQTLAIHRLPGGSRIIDAMGADEAPVTWSGIFSGPSAADRAHLLDQLRADGNALSLSWQNFTYTVLISRFEASFQRPNWIPYRITCTVLRDESLRIIGPVLSAAEDAAQDLAVAAALSASQATSPLDGFASGTVDLALAAAVAGPAAQQATASFYIARAARNSLMDLAG